MSQIKTHEWKQSKRKNMCLLSQCLSPPKSINGYSQIIWASETWQKAMSLDTGDGGGGWVWGRGIGNLWWATI